MTHTDTPLAVRARALAPGLMLAVTVAMAAQFLSGHYGVPVMLMAILLGMPLHFLAEDDHAGPGIDFAARALLRAGVALLGLRVSLDMVAAIGWPFVALVAGSVAAVILGSVALARKLGQDRAFGLLTGGSVAICGASAAMAIASVLPARDSAERDLSFTVITVTVMSTFAMIVYPMLVAGLGLNDHQAGLFLGATIHDVAQVVGAGYTHSQQTGDTATIVKLLRVAMLLPACLAIGLALHVRGATAAHAAPMLPWFAVVFAVFVMVTSMGWIPDEMVDAGSVISRWCLVTAIAAIGMKTSLKSLVDMGIKPVMLIVAETLFLASVVLGVLTWK